MASVISDQDLVSKVYQVERELVGLRFKHSTNQLENTSTLRNLRREIARLKTEARRRETVQGLAKEGLFSKFRPVVVVDEPTVESTVKGGFLKGIVDKISGTD